MRLYRIRSFGFKLSCSTQLVERRHSIFRQRNMQKTNEYSHQYYKYPPRGTCRDWTAQRTISSFTSSPHASTSLENLVLFCIMDRREATAQSSDRFRETPLAPFKRIAKKLTTLTGLELTAVSTFDLFGFDTSSNANLVVLRMGGRFLFISNSRSSHALHFSSPSHRVRSRW